MFLRRRSLGRLQRRWRRRFAAVCTPVRQRRIHVDHSHQRSPLMQVHMDPCRRMRPDCPRVWHTQQQQSKHLKNSRNGLSTRVRGPVSFNRGPSFQGKTICANRRHLLRGMPTNNEEYEEAITDPQTGALSRTSWPMEVGPSTSSKSLRARRPISAIRPTLANLQKRGRK